MNVVFAVVYIVLLLVFFLMGFLCMGKLCKKEIKYEQTRQQEMSESFATACRLLQILSKGKEWKTLLENKTFSIYGIGKLGKCLLTILENENVPPQYLIDSRTEAQVSGYEVYQPTDRLPSVDYIIVTPSYSFDEIKNSLSVCTDAEIVSITDCLKKLENGK